MFLGEYTKNYIYKKKNHILLYDILSGIELNRVDPVLPQRQFVLHNLFCTKHDNT